MTPEEAQKQTERRWLAIIASQDDVPPCGWCVFAFGMWTGTRSQCHLCPITQVVGVPCWDISEYKEWDRVPVLHNARAVYELLIAHKDQLIAAAKEIENEQG